jgi:hypothetical protein
MGTSWFGSLGLAAKYAFVRPSVSTLHKLTWHVKNRIWGTTSTGSDCRRDQNHIRQKEVSKPSVTLTCLCSYVSRMNKHLRIMLSDGGMEKDEMTELAMREKDAGDLFGIRAIEAGYYGGVAQSRGNSLANSLVGTPSSSVTDFSKSRMSSSPTVTDFTKSRRTSMANYPDPRSTTFSASSSILRLSQFGMVETHDQHGNTIRGSHLRTTSISPLQLSEPTSASKRNSTSPTKLANVKLRPSTAEQNKTHNHNPAVNMALQVPPSPVLQQHPSSFRDSPSPPSPSSSPWPPTPPLDASYTTAIFRQPMIADGDSPDAQVFSVPEHIVKTPFEVSSSQNPHSTARSVRGSVVSWSASTVRSSSPPPSLPPISVPIIKLPAFPVKAVIDYSSPKFSGFVKERSPKEQIHGSARSKGSGNGYSELPGMRRAIQS